MALLTFTGIPAAQHADAHPKRPGQQPPNIVLIHLDDMGYGDLTATGVTGYRTPNIDRLCAEGMRFTNYYSAQAVSSASRAGLLTGCYPNRIGFAGALGPKSKTGLNPDEETMAENLKKAGYATAIVGKWHVGCRPGLMPLDHGFDEYFGLPYSNDMWPHHPQTSSYPPLPLYEGRKVVNPSVSAADQAQLTTRYTEHAVDFITRRSEGPFFLYLAHSMPHVPLFVSDKFKGKSEQGLYGDVMMEIDWSVGEVLKALEKSGAASNTIVVLTSDNGPWINYGDHAGSTGGLREGKGTTFEGGQRVPCIVWWPGTPRRARRSCSTTEKTAWKPCATDATNSCSPIRAAVTKHSRPATADARARWPKGTNSRWRSTTCAATPANATTFRASIPKWSRS